MSKNTLTWITGLVTAVVFPLVTFANTNGLTLATGWPTIVAAAFVLGYVFAKTILPASSQNIALTVCGLVVGACIAIQPVILTGAFNLQAAVVALLPVVIGVLDGNPNEQNVIAGMFAKLGQQSPYPTK
ncbi:hypothetical protein KGP36_01575 [Patescibacteria group bacterium]|nr:hypothetical protein [Patescibacteria group bacterium]